MVFGPTRGRSINASHLIPNPIRAQAQPDDGFSDLEDSSNDSSTSSSGHEKDKKRKSKQSGQATEDTAIKLGIELPAIDIMRQEFSRRHFFSLESRSPISRLEHRRFVNKKGFVRIERTHVAARGRRYLADFFNTMLDIKWRYVLLLFSLSFFVSWLGFALMWYTIAYYRGDLEPEHLPGNQEANNWTPCVLEIHNFASAFLFSVETQHTIGYGSRQTTEKCPEAIFLQSLQSVVGVIIQAGLVGTFFAKLSRPKKRSETLLFSKNAVVCSRDGALCLMFRVGNMRQSQVVESHVRAILISKKTTSEGEIIPYHMTELKVGMDVEGEVDNLLFLWPAIIIHKIDDESPLYHLTAEEILEKRFEIIVTLEGIVEPTGMSIQARSSYMPDEILWGYTFINILKYNESTKQYVIDYGSFNSVYKVDMTTESAKERDALATKSEKIAEKSEAATENQKRKKQNREKNLSESSPNLVLPWPGQPYHLCYNPYQQSKLPRLSTPLLWPPPATLSSSARAATSSETEYKNKSFRRQNSSRENVKTADAETSSEEEQFWMV